VTGSLEFEWFRDGLGLLAGILVLCTFVMTSMRHLRATAIASNLAFLGYALQLGLWPIIILHGLLLPLNVWRLAQIEAARRTA
jgi:CRP/FNR family transcriptional regulator, cyclic AMP receptor protein